MWSKRKVSFSCYEKDKVFRDVTDRDVASFCYKPDPLLKLVLRVELGLKSGSRQFHSPSPHPPKKGIKKVRGICGLERITVTIKCITTQRMLPPL